MKSVDEFIKQIKNEKDPRKIVELWSEATRKKEHSGLTLKEIVVLHKNCAKEITKAASIVEKENIK